MHGDGNGQKPEGSGVEQLFLFFNVCDSGSRHHGAQSVTDPTLSIKIMEFSRMAKPTPTAMAIGSTLFLRSSSKTAYKSTGIALSNSSVMGGTSSEKLLALSPVMGYTMVLIS